MLQPERDLSRWPLFQVDFTFQNVPVRELRLGAARLQLIEVDNGTAKLDLSLSLSEKGDHLYGVVLQNCQTLPIRAEIELIAVTVFRVYRDRRHFLSGLDVVHRDPPRCYVIRDV